MPFPQSELARQRFTDIELIGAGAFGNVYRAADLRLRRMVAIKEIAATLPPGEREVAHRRFEREVRIGAKLKSPAIVAVYGSDQDRQQGEQYLYLEYAPHGTLAATIQAQGALPERQAALVARDLARAIEAHWAEDIVHRDIKPSNVLVRHDKYDQIAGAKLTDYGMAQELTVSQYLQDSQTQTGTPSYMSPEQAAGEPRLRAASDLYNVGLLLWEMLTGAPRYKHPDAPITPEELGASEQLTMIVQRALEVDLDRRYGDPAAFVRDLEAVIGPEEADEAPACPRCRSPVQPHWAVCPYCGARLIGGRADAGADHLLAPAGVAVAATLATTLLLLLFGVIAPGPGLAWGWSAAGAGPTSPTPTPVSATLTSAPPRSPATSSSPTARPRPSPAASPARPIQQTPAPPTPGPRAAPPGWPIYRGDRLPVALAYPPDWQVDESQLDRGVVVFRAPDSTSYVLIRSLGPAGGRDAATLLGQQLEAYLTRYPDGRLERPGAAAFSGVNFQTHRVRYADKGNEYIATVGVGLKDGVPWSFEWHSFRSLFDEMSERQFVPLMQSLNIYRNP